MNLKTSASRAAQLPVTAVTDSANRAAFLLGLYIELPAVDAIVEPLVQISDMLSISKVVLLDSALARLSEYDVERTHRRQADVTADSVRSEAVDFLYAMERTKIKKIAGLLWTGHTELADWYRAGIAVGVVIAAGADSRNHPSVQVVDEALSCLHTAASQGGDATIPQCGSRLVEWLNERKNPPEPRDDASEENAPTVAPVSQDPFDDLDTHPVPGPDFNSDLRQVEARALEIQDRDIDARSKDQRDRDERDQAIYEMFQKGLGTAVIFTCINRQIVDENLPWTELVKSDDLRKIANSYAARSSKPPLPEGKRGRPSKTKPE
jgi:hypothetical protein